MDQVDSNKVIENSDQLHNIEKKKRVVHLQYGSSPSGNYVLRYHEAFLERGLDSFVLSLTSNVTGDPKIQRIGKKGIFIRKLNQRIQDFYTRKMAKNSGGFALSLFGSDVTTHEWIQNADYIYVHWILGGFLSIEGLEKIAKLNKPMILVMHDMWTITGGCFHSFECQKFLSHCGNCPMFPDDKEKDLSYKQFEEKFKFYHKYDNLFFVAPSKWLFNLANEGALLKDKPVFRIPNPLDTNLFKPFDKQVAKKILNIDKYQHVISFGANKITSPYKGWKYLMAALKDLKENHPDLNICLLIFGSGPNKEIQESIPFPCEFMGFIRDDYTTNLVYNASDVFVAPSLADNLPTTILESLACGTPVVGFDVGGIPDMIDHLKNGYLAKYKDEKDLSIGLKYCLSNKLEGYLLPEFQKSEIVNQHLALMKEATKD
ncbi:glycosyltransferase [uncultured Cyclobacterium sp.]|uniref:glycosyltransferase n=1 Tax=uncultured Cyclobacterium sp. TaxID=453820 RepID=UPI0030ECCECD|tara:strand:- start:205020 stop:206309 length:1290 start_codon:yes stop_codon:yes gene_type:complete